MKKLIGLGSIVLISVFSFIASADPSIKNFECSDSTREVCAQIQSPAQFTAGREVDVVVKIFALDIDLLTNFSAYFISEDTGEMIYPRVIGEVEPGVFSFDRMQFPAGGSWRLIMDFDLKLFHQIIIPFSVMCSGDDGLVCGGW